MSITTRIIEPTQFKRACTFLRNAGEPVPNHGEDTFFKSLQVRNGADDGLVLDGMIRINNNRLELLKIWVMEYDHKKRMPSARNMNGEKGKHARILGEKYFNALFDYIQDIDIDNCDRRDITITPQLMKKVELEVDNIVIDMPLNETTAKHYNRVEIIQFSMHVLRCYLHELDIPEHDVSFDEAKNVFDITIYPERNHLTLPLLDVVNRKWEDGKPFALALFLETTDWLKTWCNVV